MALSFHLKQHLNFEVVEVQKEEALIYYLADSSIDNIFVAVNFSLTEHHLAI
jgi:hypothetical protein